MASLVQPTNDAGYEMSRVAPSYRGFKPASRGSSHAMQGNRASGTRPELLVERCLRTLGLRGKRNVRDLPGRPDIVFRRARVAVFCDGDFWHGRKWTALRRNLSQRANSRYWVAKIAYNIERDDQQRRALRKLGWKVLRFWESDILKGPQGIAGRIYSVVRERTDRPYSP